MRSSVSQSRGPRCLCLRKTDGPTPTFTWETDGALLTEFLMRNIGESPSEGAAVTLSEILEANAPDGYSLSPRACRGILRRATFGRKMAVLALSVYMTSWTVFPAGAVVIKTSKSCETSANISLCTGKSSKTYNAS